MNFLKDLQGIKCRKCRTKTKRKEKKLKDLDEVFFKKRKKINMHETNAITQKRTQENFI